MSKCQEAELLAHTMAADFILQAGDNQAVKDLLITKTGELESLKASKALPINVNSVDYYKQQIAVAQNEIDNLVMASLSNNIVYQNALIQGFSNSRISNMADVLGFVDEFKGNSKLLEKPENAIFSSTLNSIANDLGLGTNYVKTNYEQIMNDTYDALLSKAIIDYNYVKNNDFEVYAKRFFGKEFDESMTEEDLQKAFNKSESLEKKLKEASTIEEKRQIYKDEMMSKLGITDQEYTESLTDLITDPKNAQAVSQYIYIKNLLGGIGTLEELKGMVAKIKGIPQTLELQIGGATVRELQDNFFAGLGDFMRMSDEDKLSALNKYKTLLDDEKYALKNGEVSEFALTVSSIMENLTHYVRKGGVTDIRGAAQLGNANYTIYKYVNEDMANKISSTKSGVYNFIKDLREQFLQYVTLSNGGKNKVTKEALTYTRGKKTGNGIASNLKGYINSPSDFDKNTFEILDMLGVDYAVLEIPELLNKLDGIPSLHDAVDSYQKAFAKVYGQKSMEVTDDLVATPAKAREYLEAQKSDLLNQVREFIKDRAKNPVEPKSLSKSIIKRVLRNESMADDGIVFIDTFVKSEDEAIQLSAKWSDASYKYYANLPGVVNKGYNMDDINKAVDDFKQGNTTGILKDIQEGKTKSIMLQNSSAETKLFDFLEIAKTLSVDAISQKKTADLFSIITPLGQQALGFRFDKSGLTIRSNNKADIDRLRADIQAMGQDIETHIDQNPEYDQLYEKVLATQYPDATQDAIQAIKNNYHAMTRADINQLQSIVYAVSDGSISEKVISLKEARESVKQMMTEEGILEQAIRISNEIGIEIDISKYKIPEDMNLLEDIMFDMLYSRSILEKEDMRIGFLQQIGVVGASKEQYGADLTQLSVDTSKYLLKEKGIALPVYFSTKDFWEWLNNNRNNLSKLGVTEQSQAFFDNIPADINKYIQQIITKNPALKVSSSDIQNFDNVLSNLSQAMDDVKLIGKDIEFNPVSDVPNKTDLQVRFVDETNEAYYSAIAQVNRANPEKRLKAIGIEGDIQEMSHLIDEYKQIAKNAQLKSLEEGLDYVPQAEEIKKAFQKRLDEFETDMIEKYRGYIFNTADFRGAKANVLPIDQQPGLANFNAALDNIESGFKTNLGEIKTQHDDLVNRIKQDPQKFREDSEKELLSKGQYQTVQNGEAITVSIGGEAVRLQKEIPYGMSAQLDELKNLDVGKLSREQKIDLYKIMKAAKTVSQNDLPITAEGVRASLNPILSPKFYEEYGFSTYGLPDFQGYSKAVPDEMLLPKKIAEVNNITSYIRKLNKDENATGGTIDLLTKKTIFNNISKSLNRGKNFTLSDIVKSSIDEAVQTYGLNLKPRSKDKELNSLYNDYVDSLIEDFQPYESIDDLRISESTIEAFGNKMKLDYDYKANLSDKDRELLNRYGVDVEDESIGLGDFVVSNPVDRPNFAPYLDEGDGSSVVQTVPQAKMDQGLNDTESILDFLNRTNVEVNEGADIESLYRQSAFGNSGTAADAMKQTKKTEKLLDVKKLLDSGYSGPARKAFEDLSFMTGKEQKAELDIAKIWIADDSYMNDFGKESHPRAYAIADYFLTLKNKAQGITGDEVFDGAINRIEKVLDNEKDMMSLSKMVGGGKIIQMAIVVDKRLSNIAYSKVVGKKEVLNPEGYDNFVSLFAVPGERVSQAAYSLIMDTYGSSGFVNRFGKKAARPAFFTRLATGIGIGGTYGLTVQIPGYGLQITSSIARNGTISGAGDVMERVGFMKGAVWNISEGINFKDLYRGIDLDRDTWFQVVGKVFSNLGTMPLMQEMKGGLQQIADIIFRPLVQRISFLEAVRKNSKKEFDSIADYSKRLDEAPEGAYKQEIIDEINIQGSNRYDTNVGFGVGGDTDRTNRGFWGTFRAITGFKGSRGENVMKFFLRDGFGPIGYGAKYTLSQRRKKGFKGSREISNDLYKFYSNNHDFQAIWANMFLTMRSIGRLRQLQDSPEDGEETLAGEFIKTIKAMSYAFNGLTSFETNTIGRQFTTLLDSLIEGEEIGKVMSDNLFQLKSEMFKDYKSLDLLTSTVLNGLTKGSEAGWNTFMDGRSRLGDGVVRYLSSKQNSPGGSDYIPSSPGDEASFFMSDSLNVFRKFSSEIRQEANYLGLVSALKGETGFLDWMRYNVLRTTPLLNTIEQAYTYYSDPSKIREGGLRFDKVQKALEQDPIVQNFFKNQDFDISRIQDDTVRDQMYKYVWNQIQEPGIGKGKLLELLQGYKETGEASNPFIKAFIDSLDSGKLDSLKSVLSNTRGETAQKLIEAKALVDAIAGDSVEAFGASRMLLNYAAIAQYDLEIAQIEKNIAAYNKTRSKADDLVKAPTEAEKNTIKQGIIDRIMPLIFETDRPGINKIYGEYIINTHKEFEPYYKIFDKKDSSGVTKQDKVMQGWFEDALYIDTSYQMCLAQGGSDCLNAKSLFNSAGSSLPAPVRMDVINSLFSKIDTTNKTTAEKTDLKYRILDANPDLIIDIKDLKAKFPEVADKFVLNTYGVSREASALFEGVVKQGDLNDNGRTSTIGGNLKAQTESFKGLYNALKLKMDRHPEVFNSLNKNNVKTDSESKRGIGSKQRGFLKQVADYRDVVRGSGGAGAKSDRLISAKPPTDIKRAPTFKVGRKPRAGSKSKKTSKRGVGK